MGKESSTHWVTSGEKRVKSESEKAKGKDIWETQA